MVEYHLNDVISISDDHAAKPPAGDRSIAAFYTELGHQLRTPESRLRKIIGFASDVRQNPSLIISLSLRAFTLEQMRKGDLSYGNFQEPEQWREVIQNTIDDPYGETSIIDTILHKRTVTVIRDRYVGPHVLASRIFGDADITAADLGCSLNLGLPAMSLETPYTAPVIDETPDRLFSNHQIKPLSLSCKSLALDLEKPDIEWVKACRFYPQELNELNDFNQLIAEVKRSRRVRFSQDNAVDGRWLRRGVKYDLVIGSTFAYQLPFDQFDILTRNVLGILNPNGIMVVNDFAVKSDGGRSLDFKKSWFEEEDPYRTFIISSRTNGEYKEVFRWQDGRCKKVKPGEDYTEIMEIIGKDASGLVVAA